MRHKKKRILELSTGVQKKQNVIRNLLTSLVASGQMVTTIKRSKVLKATADKFFARLVWLHAKNDEATAKRESIRYVKSLIYTEKEGKKVINELLPKYLAEGKTSGFVMNVKMWPRPGDAAEKVLVKLI